MAILGFETLAAAQQGFDWRRRWDLFDGDPERFNIAHECLDRHVAAGRAGETAARVVSSDGSYASFDFGPLAELSGRFANALRDAGIGRGDAVIVVLEPGLEYFIAMFGALKSGAVTIPTSTVVSPESIVEDRVNGSDARLLVAKAALLEQLGPLPAACRAVAAEDLLAWIEPFPASTEITTSGDDRAFCVFSSGTTGRPKPTYLPHKVLSSYAVIVGSWVLGLERGDRYLSSYSPGWLGGFGWGVWVPLSLGVAAGIYGGPFRPDVFVQALRDLEINALHCPPTAYRRILNATDGPGPAIEKLAYTGEAMERELALRLQERFGTLPRGQYGATEVGFLALDYAYPDYEVRPGSIGKAVIGSDIAVIDDDGRELPPDELGWAAVRRGGAFKRLGDKVTLDADGYLWFKGRGDDVIISSGYTIGAQEVEDALRQHPAVAEVAVIGKRDPERGAIVKAFVQVADGYSAADELRRELVASARARVGAHAYPRELDFVEGFERGEGGKIRRITLHELG